MIIGVNDTGDKWKKFWAGSFFLFWWDAVGLLFTYMQWFFTLCSFWGVGKIMLCNCFIAGIVDTGGNNIADDVDTAWWTQSCELYKLEIAPMGYSRARGKQIHEKNLKTKISCQIPFKFSHVHIYSHNRLVQFLSILCTLT